MTEKLQIPPVANTEHLVRHFDDVPKRLGLKNEDGEYSETRDKDHDLAVLVVGIGRKVRRVRWQCNEWIESSPDEIRGMFCDPLPEEDVHATLWRVGQRLNIPRNKESRLVSNLAQRSRYKKAFPVWFGKKWKVGDAVMSELTADDDPVRDLREMVSEALEESDLEPCSGDFTPHSSDRYANGLPFERTQEVQDFVQRGYERGKIEPVEIMVSRFILAENWPEFRPEENFGTYRYRPLAEFVLGQEGVSWER